MHIILGYKTRIECFVQLDDGDEQDGCFKTNFDHKIGHRPVCHQFPRHHWLNNKTLLQKTMERTEVGVEQTIDI